MPPSTSGNRCWTMVIRPSERPERTKTGSSDDSIALDSSGLPNLSGPQELALVDVVPYQLRHSGASIDRARGHRSQDEVQKRGK